MWWPFYDTTWFIILPALFFTMWAQSRVQSTYHRYARVYARSGMTGAQVARRLLDEAGLYDIPVQQVHGHLADHFDPRARVIRLSAGVYQSTSLAALGIAAHETGHALQHAEGYIPLAFRNNIFPLANIGSRAAFPLFFIGLFFGGLHQLMTVGIFLFAFAVLFQLVTLPVEYNASSRAIALLAGRGFLAPDEVQPAKEVLNAAALTYLAAAAVSITQLIRLLILRDRRR
ncbi:MAG: zinc metallopeptidase [Firmicutes bacterium]|jgi:Zn-dependent membrane protease YugP|nr:zinc metallopeptidase [Bacillota bacterium]